MPSRFYPLAYTLVILSSLAGRSMNVAGVGFSLRGSMLDGVLRSDLRSALRRHLHVPIQYRIEFGPSDVHVSHSEDHRCCVREAVLQGGGSGHEQLCGSQLVLPVRLDGREVYHGARRVRVIGTSDSQVLFAHVAVLYLRSGLGHRHEESVQILDDDRQGEVESDLACLLEEETH